ncbi:MAG: DEAD/DEAH box helicase [Myxococcota bacterium]|nr:DEAD/DEAH box helicase [Myxococcota bacterium]
MNSFDALDLIEPIRRAIAAQNYTTPTPIQAKAIPPLLDGRDVLGCAQTGTGKTAAFLLPILQKLSLEKPKGKRKIRALVLSPTRELALQIGECCGSYSEFLPLRYMTMFGGVSQRPQVDDLRRGVDILVATPGRLLDLLGQGLLELKHVEHFVLDEADRMLDMGFIRDIRRILTKLPKQKQNLLFSATMPDSIVDLASSFLSNPVRVEVHPQSSAVDLITQKVMFVDRPNKKHLLVSLLQDPSLYSVVVFSRTKHGADRLARILNKKDLSASAIHGNKSQGARQRALAGFKSGDVRILVATDIASRGIDVDGVTHVINHDLPNLPESYVHRIGRTGRAGHDGVAISFCDESETSYLTDIEKLIGQSLIRDADHEWHHEAAIPKAREPGGQGARRTRRRSGRNRQPENRDSAQEQRGTETESGPSDRGQARRRRRPRHGQNRSNSPSARDNQTDDRGQKKRPDRNQKTQSQGDGSHSKNKGNRSEDRSDNRASAGDSNQRRRRRRRGPRHQSSQS